MLVLTEDHLVFVGPEMEARQSRRLGVGETLWTASAEGDGDETLLRPANITAIEDVVLPVGQRLGLAEG